MHAIALRSFRPFAAAVASGALSLLLLPAPAVAQQDASALLKRSAAAMGATQLGSIRYAGEGTGYTFGQAYTPGMAWPRITIHSQVRTVNYESGSMRDEIVLSRAEPKGGGGYPITGQQRNDQYVSGTYAWNMAAQGPASNQRLLTDRVHQLWISPHGIVKAAQRNGATVQWRSAKGMPDMAAVSFTEPGRFKATAWINDDYLVERVDSRVPDAVLGEVDVQTLYSDYRDFGGVKFPMRIRQSQGGFPVLDLMVKEVEPQAAADIEVPDAMKSAVERATATQVAPGVWHVAGGTHNSVAIEMKDHMVLVEAPLGDARMAAVLEQVKQLAPGKPIRYVINSHSHFDHSGGLRAAVAEGAIVVTQAANEPYFQRAFATPSRLAPDRLAHAGRKPRFVAVNGHLTMGDSSRKLEIHQIQDSNHSNTFLMVYLPAEKLLIQADAFTPPPPGTPPPAQPNPNNVNLVANIERLKLQVEQILPLHGRVVPMADLYAAVGANAPKP